MVNSQWSMVNRHLEGGRGSEGWFDFDPHPLSLSPDGEGTRSSVLPVGFSEFVFLSPFFSPLILDLLPLCFVELLLPLH